MEHTFFISTLVGMRAKIVALRLNQVRRQNGSAIAVIVRHCSGEGWYWYTVLNGISNHIAQRLLVFVGNLLEVWRKQKVSNTRVFRISIGNFLQELRTNDATCAEDLRDLTVVQIPVVLV